MSSGPWTWRIAFDDAVVRWFAGALTEHPKVAFYLDWLADATLFKFAPFCACLVGLWFLDRGDTGQRRALLVRSVAAAILALFLGRALQLGLPFRPRPFATPELALQLPDGLNAGLTTWSSFPSDHAVVAFALTTAVWLVSRRLGPWLLAHAVLVVCLPRVIMARHYPTDIIAGAVVGAMITWIVVQDRVGARLSNLMLAMERRWPVWFYGLSFLLLFEIAENFDSVREIADRVFRALQRRLA